jgi:hypothetical protein
MEMISPIDALTVRILAQAPCRSYAEARCQAEKEWKRPSVRISSIWWLSTKRSGAPLNPFASELFSEAVMRRLCIRTAESFLCSANEAYKFADGFVVKFAKDNQPQNMKWDPNAVPDRTCLVSKLIPNAASISFVTRKVLKTHPDKSEAADSFYKNFDPSPKEIETIRAAISVEAAPYLEICAARAFLGDGCTSHFGNVLVTKQGQLVSIDHAHAHFQSGEDLRNLFDFVDYDSELFRVLGTVAALRYQDMRESLAEVPNNPVCGSTDGIENYFCTRLKLWKELYAAKGM